MTFFQKQLFFWLGFGLLLGGLLYLLGNVVAPFVVGLVLAYILDPFVDWLERFYVPRSLAAVLGVLLSFSFLVGLLLLLLPILLHQLSVVLKNLPAMMEGMQGFAVSAFPFLENITADVPKLLFQTEEWLPKELLGGVASSLIAGGQNFISFISFLIITPVVTIYILRDWDKLLNYFNNLLPKKNAAHIQAVISKMDEALSASLRGLSAVCLSLAVFYGTALHLLGLEFGLLIGIFSGLISFIPYAGAILGFILAIQAGLLQFWPDWQWALLLCGGVFGIGQLLEGYVLTPHLVGGKVGVPVVGIIFALMAFGALGGFVGLMVALPASAVIAVLLREGLQTYQASDYYNQ